MDLSTTIESTIAHTQAQAERVDLTPATDAAVERTLAERDADARASATAAGGVLEKIIQTSVRDAHRVVQRIMTEIPTDSVEPNRAVQWDYDADGELTIKTPTMDEPLHIHRHALGQIAAKYDVPLRYLTRLTSGKGEREPTPWERGLALTTLRQHASNVGGRIMLRHFGGQVRGIMSDRYERIDSRPILDSLLTALDEAGFVVSSGRGSDVKVCVRALYPHIYDIHGDPNVFGIEWHNSDYGAGKHEIRVYLLRTACINGMTGESIISQTHVGKKIDADVKLAADTLAARTDFFVKLVRDTVRDKAGPTQRERTIERVRKAAGERIELGEHLPTALRRALTKPEQDRMRALFDSDESVMLPPAPTTHRLANVLSWMARTAGSEDRALELEALAGNTAGI